MKAVSKVASVESPTKGINSYHSLVNMPDGFALTLRNMFAQPYGCQVRLGYVNHSNLNGKVSTLIPHNTPSPRLYAAVNDKFWDVTDPHSLSIEVALTVTNPHWQYVNFSNAAGVHVVAVNGVDDMTWFKPDHTVVAVGVGDGTAGTIKGVDPKKLIGVTAHQKRLWFVEKRTSQAWYLPPDQIFGEAKVFDFGPLMTKGGYLMQLATWTIDDGDGADDHLVAITSAGQAIVYSGINPDSADTWGLRGVYYVGIPVGYRAATKYGGDLAILTVGGLVLLSQMLESTKVNPTANNPGQVIQHLLSSEASKRGGEFGWQIIVFPSINMLMINVPMSDTLAYQLVMNDITKAWSEFIGYYGMCWAEFNGTPVFGGEGGVFRAWEEYTDGASIDVNGIVTNGRPIQSEAQSNFSFFAAPGINKHYKMVRPYIISQGKFSLEISVNVGFTFTAPTAPVDLITRSMGAWDQSTWDNAIWGGGYNTYQQWSSVLGIGSSASIRVRMVTSSETYWVSTDWLYEVGGVM